MPPTLQSIKNAVVTYFNVRFRLFGAPKIKGGTFEKHIVAAAYKKENNEPCIVEAKLHWKFERAKSIHYPATFVSDLINGRVWGHEGTVIDNQSQLFSEVSRHYNDKDKELQIFKQRVSKNPAFYDATIAVIATAGGHVYYHWMLDIIPRIELLKKNGSFSTIDFFVVEYLELKFQKEILQKLGIPESKILPSNDPFNFHIQARKLLVPSLVSPNDAPSLEACLFIRSLFREDKSNLAPFRRLYIQRKKGRTITNEKELSNFLSANGFEIVQSENMSVAQQAHLFSEAKFVVAPHGAGLTNLVFCEPETKVIDIFSPQWVNPCYWILSSHLQLQYAYLMGEGEEVPEHHDPQQKAADISVNLSKFKEIYYRLESNNCN